MRQPVLAGPHWQANPPSDPSEIAIIAQQARGEGLDAVVLIGQGGSTQAPQTVTKLYSLEVTDEVPFKTMDALSPVYVNHILGSSDPARTLYIVSSKSGTTLEPNRALARVLEVRLRSPGCRARRLALYRNH